MTLMFLQSHMMCDYKLAQKRIYNSNDFFRFPQAITFSIRNVREGFAKPFLNYTGAFPFSSSGATKCKKSREVAPRLVFRLSSQGAQDEYNPINICISVTYGNVWSTQMNDFSFEIVNDISLIIMPNI